MLSEAALETPSRRFPRRNRPPASDYTQVGLRSGIAMDSGDPFYYMESSGSEITVTLSHARKSTARDGQWKLISSTFGEFADELSNHKSGRKEGSCFLQGEAIGGARKAAAMEANRVLAIDIDGGVTRDWLFTRLKNASVEAIVYTTYNHLKTTTIIKRDAYLKWAGADDVSLDGVAEYLSAVRLFSPELVKSIAIVEENRHDSDGVMIVIEHDPIEKYRVVLPLAEPFVFANRGGTHAQAQIEWKERYAGACRQLGLPFDAACTDPARLFYFPRHPEGATEYGTWRFAGEPLDLEAVKRAKVERMPPRRGTLQADDRAETAYVIASGLDLRSWAHGYADRFEVETCLSERLGPEDLRDPRSANEPGIHVACPFEDEHSTNGGNGTFVVNASDNIDGGRNGFAFHCAHNACSGRDRLNHLVELIRQGVITEGDLTDPAYLIPVEDDDPAPATPVVRKVAPALENHFKGRTPEERRHLTELNEKYAVVALHGSTKIAKMAGDGPVFMSRRDVATYEEPRIVRVKGDASGTRDLKMFEEWIKWSGRRAYEDVQFAPGQDDPQIYNLFHGWSVTPRSGNWSMMQDHLRQMVCRNDDKLYDWLVTYLAHMFQRPWEKPGVAVVIRGEKGCGKSIILDMIQKAMKPYFYKQSDGRRALGNFNAAYEQTLLLLLEEAVWAGDQARESILKDLITSPSLSIERKGINSYMAKNYMRVFMLSNERWVAPASGKERRFGVFDCDNQHCGDLGYFSRLVSQMENGGTEAMLDDLLNFTPANGWDVLRVPPHTAGLDEQKIESLRGINRFMYDLVARGTFEASLTSEASDFSLSEGTSTKIALTDLKGAVADYLVGHCQPEKKLTLDDVDRAVREWFGACITHEKVDKNRKRFATIPPLAACREHIRSTKGITIVRPDYDA